MMVYEGATSLLSHEIPEYQVHIHLQNTRFLMANVNITLKMPDKLVIPHQLVWAPPWSSSSMLDDGSLPPVFESRCGHI